MDVPIIVRFDGKPVQIRANLDWTIYQLKQQLYLHCNKRAEDLKIIFAGSEIGNTVLLKVLAEQYIAFYIFTAITFNEKCF